MGRLHGLPWEYWDEEILMNIAHGIEAPLKNDKATMEGKFGHFTRILIDVDLSNDIPD